MTKLSIKDKKLRFLIKNLYKTYYILKSIFKSCHYLFCIRLNAKYKLKELRTIFKISAVLNRCVYSISKKRFNKFTLFSRFLYLKFLKSGEISGFKKK
jgi:hypothetical protein